jgi:hypothetical protein
MAWDIVLTICTHIWLPYISIICLVDIDGTTHMAGKMEPSHAEESLKVWLALDGNCEKVIEELQWKARGWASQALCGTLTAAEMWNDDCYNHHCGGDVERLLQPPFQVSKTLEYPLVALTLRRRNATRYNAR